MTSGQALRVAAFDAAVRAVVDWLVESGAIDPDRIGIFGKSTGGLLVLHAAAHEPRLKAVVAHPVSYAWSTFFEQRFPLYPSKLEVFTMVGATSLAEGTEIVSRELTLDDVAERLNVPILGVNGIGDRLITPDQAEMLKSRATCPVEIDLLPGRTHSGKMVIAFCRDSDWMRERLG